MGLGCAFAVLNGSRVSGGEHVMRRAGRERRTGLTESPRRSFRARFAPSRLVMASARSTKKLTSFSLSPFRYLFAPSVYAHLKPMISQPRLD